jgi:Protein of unknown function (DUF732)
MKRSFAATVGSLIVVAAGTGLAAPAQADTTTDTFLNALTTNGLGNVASGNAVELGKSICPMLADSGQSTADIASKVADTGGMSLGPATMFTGLAISVFCPGAIARLSDPAAISNVVNGQSPILQAPIPLLSILGR